MLFSQQQLLSDTRIWLGHNHEDSQLIAIEDPYTLSLDELILSKIEMAAHRVLMDASWSMLVPGSPIRTRLAWRDSPGRGMAVLSLPDDFMRLLSVRLSDWKRPARIIAADNPSACWQSSPFAGVRGNPSRPVAVITSYPSGMVAELYSSTAGPSVRLVEAQYVPYPRLVDGFINLPEPLYHDVVALVAQLTMQSYHTDPICGQHCD